MVDLVIPYFFSKIMFKMEEFSVQAKRKGILDTRYGEEAKKRALPQKAHRVFCMSNPVKEYF